MRPRAWTPSCRRCRNVTRVELGRPGERKLAVHFRDGGDAAANATQIAVLQALAAAGVAMLEMSRGQSLQDKVIEITRPEPTRARAQAPRTPR